MYPCYFSYQFSANNVINSDAALQAKAAVAHANHIVKQVNTYGIYNAGVSKAQYNK